ncbi:hypothetical protein RE428_28680 [Marinobacter nanhaiticus D15-8W]|nr:hypothetical protein RE428_28680 [Marinobacter nanhaiticus D15-8W]
MTAEFMNHPAVRWNGGLEWPIGYTMAQALSSEALSNPCALREHISIYRFGIPAGKNRGWRP